MEHVNKNEMTAERLCKALRWAGTSAVVLSAVAFMLQGLTAMSSFERFLSFAAMSATLAAFGIFAGAKMKESKSARTLLGLAGAATPVLFSHLGAMIFAATNGIAAADIPGGLLITAPSPVAFAIALASTVLIMAPVLYLGFGAFFRARANELAIMMLASSALLLIPSRDADIAGLLIAVQTVALTAFAMKARKKPAGEIESLVAGILPLLPSLILIGRQAFYGGSNFFAAGALLLVSGLLLEIVPYLAPLLRGKIWVFHSGLVAAGAAWVFFVLGILDFMFVPKGMDGMLALYPVAIALLLVPKGPRLPAQFLSLFVPLACMLSSWSIGTALIFIALGLFAATLGFSKRNQPVFESGLLTSALGMIYYLVLSMKFIYSMPWVSLAVIGITTIMAAAWLEKNRHKLGRWRLTYSNHFTRS